MDKLEMTNREHRLELLFTQWVTDDAGRSLGALARKNDIPVSEMVKHAAKFKWQKRLAAITTNAAARIDGILEETIVDVNKRQITHLRAFQKKAWKYLEHAQIDKPSDAIKMMFESIKLEREILGLGEKAEDVATVMIERMEQAKKKESAPKIEFEFCQDFVVEELGDDPEEELQ